MTNSKIRPDGLTSKLVLSDNSAPPVAPPALHLRRNPQKPTTRAVRSSRAKKTRERELFETLRVADHGKKAEEESGTGDGLEDGFFGQENEEARRYGKAAAIVASSAAAAAAAAAAGLEGGKEEEERLLRAVDNGDLDL